MSTPSDTPRTDVRPAIEIYEEAGLQYADSLISRDFARQLERELNETKEKLAIAMRFAETRLEHINILTQKIP